MEVLQYLGTDASSAIKEQKHLSKSFDINDQVQLSSCIRFQPRPSSFKQLLYICDGDHNGVIHYAGTSYGEHPWMNPVLAKKIFVTASSPLSQYTDAKALVSRRYQATSFARPCNEDGKISAWWKVDLGEGHQVANLLFSCSLSFKFSAGIQDSYPKLWSLYLMCLIICFIFSWKPCADELIERGRGIRAAIYIGSGKGSNARENGTYKIANKGDNSTMPPYTNENVQAKACASGTRLCRYSRKKAGIHKNSIQQEQILSWQLYNARHGIHLFCRVYALFFIFWLL